MSVMYMSEKVCLGTYQKNFLKSVDGTPPIAPRRRLRTLWNRWENAEAFTKKGRPAEGSK